jgi:prepilin-type N-terminal cleavage/methylation domain-containing protein
MRALERHGSSNQRGDTIIEVLIAVAIISLILAASYGIVNRNIATNQDTQEHSQGQQIVQRQIELLRAGTQASTLAFIDGGCFSGGSFINDSAACSLKADGVTGGCTDEPCYHLSITVNDGIYTVTAKWFSVRGDTSRITMEYGV